MFTLNDKDHIILSMLQVDYTVKEIASFIGISRQYAHTRITRMKKAGILFKKRTPIAYKVCWVVDKDVCESLNIDLT